MSRLLFLRILLLLPLLLPALAWGVVTAAGEAPEMVGGLAVLFVYSGLFGGGPYLLFLTGVAWFLHGRTAEEHLRFFWFAPIFFMVVVFLSFLGVGVLENGLAGFDVGSWIRTSSFYSACSLAFGYLYVLLARLMYGLTERLGLFVHAA